MAEKFDMTDILIVGAGPVGLFAALVFFQMGYRIRIVDKLDRHVERSGGCRIIPRSMELIAKHVPDVAEEIEQIASKPTDFATYYDGKKVNSISQADPSCRYQYSYILPSKRAVELVFEKKLQNLGVNIERSTVVSDLEVEEVEGSSAQKTNPVIVTMQKQPAGTPTTEIVRARYLIAADGPRSFCRRKLGISFDGPQDVLHMADLGLVGRSTHPDAHNCCVIKSEKSGSTLYLPAQPNVMKFVMHLNDDSKMPLPMTATVKDVIEKLRAIIKPWELQVESVRYFEVYARSERIAASFCYKNRVFLVGGAARVPSPKLTPELNIGLNDLHNLAWKLHLHEHASANPIIFDTYDIERKELSMLSIRFANLNQMRPLGMDNDPDEWRPQKQQRFGISPSYISSSEDMTGQPDGWRRFLSGLGLEYSPNILNWTNDSAVPSSPSALRMGQRVPDVPIAQVSVMVPSKPNSNPTSNKDKDKEKVSISRKQTVRLYDFLRDSQLFQILVLVGDPVVTPGAAMALHEMDSHLRSESSFQQRYKRGIAHGGDLFHLWIVTTSNKILSKMPGLGFLKHYRVIVDEFGECHEKFGVDVNFGEGMVYVIRPDDFVGAMVTLTEFPTLEQYFEQFLEPSV